MWTHQGPREQKGKMLGSENVTKSVLSQELEMLIYRYKFIWAIFLDGGVRKTLHSVISVTATGFPVLTSMTFSSMLITSVLEKRATIFTVQTLFALMAGGFSRLSKRRILTSMLRIRHHYNTRQPWNWFNNVVCTSQDSFLKVNQVRKTVSSIGVGIQRLEHNLAGDTMKCTKKKPSGPATEKRKRKL